MSRDQWNAIRRENQFHLNMQRVLEDHGALNAGDFADGTYHKFRGSDRMIDNPLSNMLQSTEQIAKKAQINFTKQRILDTVKPFGDMVQPADKADVDTITVKEDARRVSSIAWTRRSRNTVNSWGEHVPPALWGALSCFRGRLKALWTLIASHVPLEPFPQTASEPYPRFLREAGGLEGICRYLQRFRWRYEAASLDTLGGTMGHERDL